MIITSEAIRSARVLLGWDQARLAQAAGITVHTVKRVESRRGALAAQTRTLSAIRAALEASGVEIVSEQGGAGVRLSLGGKPS